MIFVNVLSEAIPSFHRLSFLTCRHTFPKRSSSRPNHWFFLAIIYKLPSRTVLLVDLFLFLFTAKLRLLPEEALHTCHYYTPPLAIICPGLTPSVHQQEQTTVLDHTLFHRQVKPCLVPSHQLPQGTVTQNQSQVNGIPPASGQTMMTNN